MPYLKEFPYMKTHRTSTALFFIVLFALGITAGYIYFSKKTASLPQAAPEAIETKKNFTSLKIYYPFIGGIGIEERLLEISSSAMEAAITEFLAGPSGKASYVPKGAQLLGIYNGADGILYINLSEEFKGNFEGDARAEALLLEALLKTITSNAAEVNDIKVLIAGKEVESLGGHLFLLYPLKNIFYQEVKDTDIKETPGE